MTDEQASNSGGPGRRAGKPVGAGPGPSSRALRRRDPAAAGIGARRPGGAADRGYIITQAAVGPDGALLGAYDKLHIAQFGASMEKEYFRRGDHCRYSLLHDRLEDYRALEIIRPPGAG